MAEMRVERKNVKDYLINNKFLIPLYQRSYAWGENECLQLFDDVYNFFKNKDEVEEYFLGSIVMYKENGRQNIIDGQQRTTTLLLLIRAIYEKTRNLDNIDKLKADLKSCLWDTDPLTGAICFDKMHLKSEVATDSDNASLENLFKETFTIEKDVKKQSLYEKNFIFFRDQINELAKNEPTNWYGFCLCLLNCCVILPIECDACDKALRIFNTLNNRGLSLSPADIFKGLIFAKKGNKKTQFAQEWRELENNIQNSSYLKKENMSFLFVQYEHIIRAKEGEVDTTMPSVLDFWTKKDKENSKKKKVNFGANYDLLDKNETFEFIKELGEFWCDPYVYLSDEGKKYFMVLNMHQNNLWQMVVSMCFYEYRKDEKTLQTMLDRILPQVSAYCALGLMYGKGGNSGLFWGFMKANVNIHNKVSKIFEKSLNLPVLEIPSLENFIEFSCRAVPKQIRYILALYALIYDKNQEVEWNHNKRNYDIIKAEIEHIFPRKWQDTYYNNWNREEAERYLGQIGNKMLIEKKFNIQAGNNYFIHKKEHYKNSNFKEAKDLSITDKKDWDKYDIELRNKQIYKNYEKFFIEVLHK